MLARIGRAALLPWWTAQLLTGTKSFERNRVIGSSRLNRHGLHEARVRLAHDLAERRRNRLEYLVSAADRADFARDSFVVRRDFLPQAEFAALCDRVQAYRGPLREIAEGDTITRKIALDPRTLRALPVLAALPRRSLLGWQFGDLLHRAGIKRHRWRRRTGLPAFDPAAFDPA